MDEDEGVIMDEFRVILLGNITSEQNITFNVTISGTTATEGLLIQTLIIELICGIFSTPGDDFRPTDGLYSYILTIPAGQTYVFINPIEIIDDLLIEGDEDFTILLTAGPEVPVDMDRMLATVTIIDNDFGKQLTIPHYSFINFTSY